MTYLKPPKLTFSERLFAIAVLSVTLHLSFPQFTHAAVPIMEKKPEMASLPALVLPLFDPSQETMSAPVQPLVLAQNELKSEEPNTRKQKTSRTIFVLVTAYSSTPDQTDGSPYITAKNTFVRDGIVASNFLSFNTRIRVPKYFGDKEFIVEDRMNERFSERIDIWMPTRDQAKAWGARWVKVEVL